MAEAQGMEWAARLDAARGDMVALAQLGRQLESSYGPRDVPADVLVGLSDQLLATGSVLLAVGVATQGLHSYPDDADLHRVMGLALARLKSLDQSQRHLETAVRLLTDTMAATTPAAPPSARSLWSYEECLGALARVHKDLGLASHSHAERTAALTHAKQLYTESYERFSGTWSGVNAAAIAAMLGDRDEAAALAGSVRKQAETRLQEDSGDRYWLEASVAECLLIEGQFEDAVETYRLAASLALEQGRTGDLASTRRQALRLLDALHIPMGSLNSILQPPSILIFSGHRFDEKRRWPSRLPREDANAIRVEIAAQLRSRSNMDAYSSLSAGADLIFVEWAQENGIPVHIVLPCSESAYRLALARQGAEDFIPRICLCLERARTVTIASPRAESPAPADYNYCNELMVGLARLRAEELDGRVQGLVVWDGQEVEHVGGTFDALRCMQLAGVTPIVIWPRNDQRPAAIMPRSFDRESDTHAFLFADFRGFSNLSESAVQFFVEVVWGEVAKRIEDAGLSARGPLAANTWGDGLFLVFNKANHAALFALGLCEWTRRVHTAPNLPQLAVRVALHAGPAKAYIDPVTQRANYFGSHVSYASRLEPITPPHEVYASQPFAAMLYSEQPRTVEAQFVGILDWAKRVGAAPTYRITR
jgi:class 3 adenylate cyclase/tetratricopeptide (TPR) repeat protein